MASTEIFEDTNANVSVVTLAPTEEDDISPADFKTFTAYKIRKLSILFVKQNPVVIGNLKC